MDYHNDQDFRTYYASMIEGSPTESFASPDQGGDYFYDVMGHHNAAAGVSYEEEEEEHTPSDEGTPVAIAVEEGKKKGKKRRKKRDPKKPKGWLTANLTYYNANRPRVKQENPNATFGDIARLLSAEYKALSPEDRSVWEKASADDRARFDHEMLSYVPPSEISDVGGSDCGVEETILEVETLLEAEEEAEVEVEEDEPKAKKPRKKKDPNAPKRGLSAWQLFSSGTVRKKVQAELPGTTVKEVMAILSERYKVLSEEEMAHLDRLVAADKERYQREMADYRERGTTTTSTVE